MTRKSAIPRRNLLRVLGAAGRRPSRARFLPSRATGLLWHANRRRYFVNHSGAFPPFSAQRPEIPSFRRFRHSLALHHIVDLQESSETSRQLAPTTIQITRLSSVDSRQNNRPPLLRSQIGSLCVGSIAFVFLHGRHVAEIGEVRIPAMQFLQCLTNPGAPVQTYAAPVFRRTVDEDIGLIVRP